MLATMRCPHIYYNQTPFRYSRWMTSLSDGSGGGELWRDCVRWLLDMRVLRPTDKAAQSDATLRDLALTLRDGVVLCSLMNELVPHSIDPKDIPQQNMMSEFICQRVICLFLGRCMESPFSLQENDLFHAWELYRAENFAKVLNTLSLLSHSEAALRKNVSPFPSTAPISSSTSCLPSSSRHVHAEDEDIYRTLKDTIDTVDIDTSTFDVDNRFHRYSESPDKIYDHIVCRQDSKRETKQDDWSTFRPETKREHCIKELLDTEQNYVEKALDMIVNKFFSPLQAHMKEKDHKTVFMNIVDVYNLHHSFYNDLRQAVLKTLGLSVTHDGRPASLARNIGEVFIMSKDKFTAYGPYCKNLDDSREKILELMKNDTVVKSRILECTAAVNDNQFKLQDLLCLPMQRVLKYHILLSELIKSTDVGSPDRRSLQDAMEAMQDVNAFVNEMKRDAEHQKLIMCVQKDIQDLSMPDGVSLMDYGRLNIDGEVRLAESTQTQNGKLKTRHVFVFDKVLIVCKARGNSNVYRSAYILSELTPDPDNAFNSGTVGTITKKLTGAVGTTLHLMREDKTTGLQQPDPVRHLTMQFKSAQVRDTWLKKFEEAKDNVQPRVSNGHQLHYETFPCDTIQKCSVCTLLLKGLMYQAYKCQSCGQVMHRRCVEARPCSGRRMTQTPQSLNGASTFPMRQHNTFQVGERLVALTRVAPQDTIYLSFEKGAEIEVVQTDPPGYAQGVIKGKTDGRVGLVETRYVRRPRSSMVGLTPMDSSKLIDRKNSTLLPQRPPQLTHTMSDVSTRFRFSPPPCNNSDYMNTEVVGQIWYQGSIERNEAAEKLKGSPNGTFLVRFSPNRGKFAISISYNQEVKHTIVEYQEMMYYLDEGIQFNSVVELVNYYKDHNLSESFQALDTSLRQPYRQTKELRVIHDFERKEERFLEIRKGDILTLVDTIGEDRGWWKGRIGQRVGFFPLSYVEEMDGNGSVKSL